MGSLQRLPKVIVYGRTPSSLEGVYEIKYYTRQSRRRRRTEAACTSSRTWSCCKRTSLIQLSSAENPLISPPHILSLLLPCCTTVSLPCLLIYISQPPPPLFSPKQHKLPFPQWTSPVSLVYSLLSKHISHRRLTIHLQHLISLHQKVPSWSSW